MVRLEQSGEMSSRGKQQTLPRDARVDSTSALLRKPYDYVSDAAGGLGSDIFETRILLRPTTCMKGAEAAELFYDESRFERRGAMPEPVRATLLGKGGVQGLDGEEHRHRKAMFMAFMTDRRVAELAAIFEREWLLDAARWSSMPQVQLYRAIQPVLLRSVCEWSGVPLPAKDVARRARDIVPLFDRAASLGVGHLRARLGRVRSERWLSGLVADVRSGRLIPPPESALAAIADHRDASGRQLASRIAAVELLNVVRPTVAVSVYIVFVAHALHSFGVDAEADGWAHRFVQEVRRFYPFFPALVAKCSRGFIWKEAVFPKGRRVLLDLHGTNHSPDWHDPDVFRPARFQDQEETSFMFIPQGGGDHHRHHRCPGEAITLALMKVAVGVLTARMAYEVPDQNLAIDRSRLPAVPASRFVLTNVLPIRERSA